MAVMTEQPPKYISIRDVAAALGVERGTVYYHIRRMKLKPKKFPMDKHTYLSRADYEKLRRAQRAAKEGQHE